MASVPAPFLTHLGISEIQQARTPDASAFPLAFNTNCRNIWEQIVLEQERARPKLRDPVLAWAEAVRAFIRECEARDQFPFQRTAVDQTSKVSQFLTGARRALVEFVETNSLFDHISSIADVQHESRMDSRGFRITMSGRSAINDPTFGQFIADSGFAATTLPRRVERALAQGLTFWFEPEESGTHWRLGYVVECPEFPDHPSTDLPSAQALERFILSVLWTPLMRAHRTNRYGRRLV